MKSKNVIKGMLFLAIMVIGSTSVFAKGKIVVSPYLKTTYAIIAVETAEESISSVVITKATGEVVYSRKKIENGAIFSGLFDFSLLEDGEYKVTLKRKGAVSVEELFMVKDGVLVPRTITKDVAGLEVLSRRVAHRHATGGGMAVRVKSTNSSTSEGNGLLSFNSGNKVMSYEFR